MQIPIELLSIIFLFFIFISWFIYKKITDWTLSKKYNSNDDKSRKGEEQRRANQVVAESIGTKSIKIDDVPKPSEPSERTIIQDGNIGEDGKDSNSIGKQSARGFFSRFKKK